VPVHFQRRGGAQSGTRRWSATSVSTSAWPLRWRTSRFGWKESFFGDLHAQGHDAIDFYTQKKVVVERWPSTWSRKF